MGRVCSPASPRRSAWLCQRPGGGLAAFSWPYFGRYLHRDRAAQRLAKRRPQGALEKQIGTGYSAPAIRDGRLVLFHRVKNEEIVQAFDVKTAKPLWQHSYPPATAIRSATTTAHAVRRYSRRSTASPTAPRVSALSRRENRQAGLAAKDAEEFQIPEAFFGVGASPVLEGDLLIVMVGGQPNSTMVAFNKDTGKTVWESVGQKTWEGKPAIGWPGEPLVRWNSFEKLASYATPTLATVNGKRMLFSLTGRGWSG